MQDDVETLIARLRTKALTNADIADLSRLLQANVSQSVSQSGQSNVTIGQSTDTQVGDRYIGPTIEQIRLIIQELNTFKSSNSNPPQLDDRSLDDLPFPQLSLDPSTLKAINLRLTVIQEIYEAGYLTESHREELRQLKQNLQSFKNLNQDLQRITEEGDRLLKSFLSHMRQQLDDLKRSGQEVTEQIQQNLGMALDIDCQQAEIKIMKTFVRKVENSRLGANWIERSKEALLNYAIKTTFQQLPELRPSEQAVDDFRRSLKQFLEQVNFCLYWGSYNILNNPEIPLVFGVEAYEIAFQAMKEFIPLHLNPEVIQEIKACLDYLISRLPTYS